MTRCDVIVAGGGPAGSTCAWALHQAGLDVVVLDRAIFPRDKVCAGWITPQVVSDLRLDLAEYGHQRTLQPFTSFRVGMIGDARTTDITYGHPVSYGIRRCEFDTYLLERSSARLQLGTPVTRISRQGTMWTVNDSITAPMLVGAGGHFCEVARMLNGPLDAPDTVVAQEAEVSLHDDGAWSPRTLPERPEIYFARSLDGYGWCIRKGEYLNVGFGRLRRGPLPAATQAFVTFLHTIGVIDRVSFAWKGHAYALHSLSTRRIVDEGVMLVGDAAGLAFPRSGEGIRPAAESGLIAASTIIAARGRYTAERLREYEQAVRERGGRADRSTAAAEGGLSTVGNSLLAAWLIRLPWFVRHVVLDRWFLHANEPPLAISAH